MVMFIFNFHLIIIGVSQDISKEGHNNTKVRYTDNKTETQVPEKDLV